jgi:diadenosine tetraphosphatase ApaH/serine/threonine PP2A family protein phosphatase
VRALDPVLVIRGNHDKVAAGVEDAQGFNTLARTAALWTHDVLTPDNRNYLAGLPAGPIALDDRIEICHGAPFDEDAYIFEDLDAIRAAKAAGHPVCLFGHTHIPLVFTLSAGAFDTIFPVPADTHIQFRPESRYLINAGSIGQPRDGDPRAAYGLVDLERQEMWLRRVEYPVEQAQDKIIKAGLPDALAQRLAMGR